jgi:hypothetical protein
MSVICIIQTVNILQTIVAKIAVITTTAGEMENFVVLSIFRFTFDTFEQYNKDKECYTISRIGFYRHLDTVGRRAVGEVGGCAFKPLYIETNHIFY